MLFRSPNDDVSRKCLHKLQAICGHHMTLPSSYNMLSGDLARVGDHLVASGGFADVWKGTHSRREVCIKCLRITMKNREAVMKVRIMYWHTVYMITDNLPWAP